MLRALPPRAILHEYFQP
uniref:Uncharacterized protein n=1 Tax=Anguilla anguilla TaxID=7936 RepID=A0A0E9VH90_ANGAN